MSNRLFKVIVALQILVIVTVISFISAGELIINKLNTPTDKIEISAR